MKNYTKKEIKALKKEVIEYGAINIGYYHNVENKNIFEQMNPLKLIDILKENYNIFENKSTNDNDFLQLYLSNCGYQEFKKFVPFFFGY